MAYFCFGSENGSWSQAILDRIKGWETKVTRRSFRFKKKEDEALKGYCQKTARAAGTIWTKKKLSFLSEVIAESMWRAMGWPCDPKPNAVVTTLKHTFYVVAKNKSNQHER